MGLIYRLAATLAVVLVTGCAAAPPAAPAGRAFVITSDPLGATVLVRDCPTCADRAVGTTPYTSPLPGSELDGRFVHVALDGYAEIPPRQVSSARADQSRPINFDLIAMTAAILGAGPPAEGDAKAVVISAAEFTSSYRSPVASEHAVYEPATADAQFLVVSTRALLRPGTVPPGTTDASQVPGYEARLLGPKPGQERKPIFTHHRLTKDTLDLQHAFSVPQGETGPYRLWVDGRIYPLSPTATGAAAPAATVVVPPAGRRPVKDAAVAAGTAALGVGEAAAPAAGPGTYHLCAQMERYALCGERACRPDGLLSKTTLTCRVRGCAPAEVPKTASGASRSLAGCVTACRQAQAAAEREGLQGSVPVYCDQ